jgi:integrase
MNLNDSMLRHTEADAFAYQCTRCYSRADRSSKAVIRIVGRLARRRLAKDASRDQLMGHIDRLISVAQTEGRAQVMALGGARHAVLAGGIRGELLAPVSLYDYLRVGLPKILSALQSTDPESLDSEGWLTVYREALTKVPASQSNKLAAFFEAFHRFAVIVGCDPLDQSILRGQRKAPPDARIVWHDEQEDAIDYAQRADASDDIKRQAVLGLRLGFSVPIRIHELWGIRLVDVLENADPPVLAISPRRRDGINKAPSSRRQIDLYDPSLIALLIDQKRLRQAQSATDEDVLFGVPRQPDGRLEERATTRLMNFALKDGTGDPTASYHDLRHGCASREGERILMEGANEQ